MPTHPRPPKKLPKNACWLASLANSKPPKTKAAALSTCSAKASQSPAHAAPSNSWPTHPKTNILRVVEEVHFNPKDSTLRLDLVLFTNGIPVATIELKSEYTRTLDHTLHQYLTAREHSGTLAHFAIAQDEIAMTTRPEAKAPSFHPSTAATSAE
ncbi:hypothetical protein JTP09_01590 [Rothia sp. ZJ1223]|nr:hypothetical protein [Rothia sp. ZJ1223]